LIVTGVLFIALVLVLPLISVFIEALRGGFATFFQSVTSKDTWQAVRLTLLVAGIAVPLNVLFGLAAAWAIAKFDFKGKSLLITLIDCLLVSPVISGLIYVLLYGATAGSVRSSRNSTSDHLQRHGLVLATIFVTFPFVARELIPLMQEQGRDEEEAAISLGASGLRTFWHVTLPNVAGACSTASSVQRARDGRVRRGLRRVRPYPRPHQHDAAACRDSLQRVRFSSAPLRSRLCWRPCDRDPGGEIASGMALWRPPRGRTEALTGADDDHNGRRHL
jgi:ABC-type tungstate transport system substrate-binding protein